MLYDTVGPALLAMLEPDQFQSTLALNVNFLRPVRPGRVVGKGRVVHRDGDMAFIEASLLDSVGTLIATATATARVIPLERARSALRAPCRRHDASPSQVHADCAIGRGRKGNGGRNSPIAPAPRPTTNEPI